MERLTARRLIDGKADAVDFDLDVIQEAYEKLCEYEDAEEQGRLIILPCAPGDTVYMVTGRPDCGATIEETTFADAEQILEEEDFFGDFLFTTKEDAEKYVEKRWGSGDGTKKPD